MISSSPTNSAYDFSQKQVASGGVTRTGNLMKLGDGLMNRTWNPRYFLLRGSSLQYFATSRDVKPREVVDLLNAEVVWLGDYLDRSNCIVVEPVEHRTLHVSGSSLDEAKQWLRWLQEAADPQAYAGLTPVIDFSSPIAQEELNESTRVPEPGLPADIPVQFSEAGDTLVKFLLRGESRSEWALVDVTEGIRLFASPKGVSRTESDKMFVIYGLIAVAVGTVLEWNLLSVVFLVYLFAVQWVNRFKNNKSCGLSAGIATIDVTARGCRNWVLDACKHQLWMPSLSESFFSRDEEIHYIFERNRRISMSRHSWERKDGSFCVAFVDGTTFEAWSIEPLSTRNKCLVSFVSTGFPGILTSTDRVKQSLSGLARITAELGDHDGSGIPDVNLTGWKRHVNGGLVCVSSDKCINTSFVRNKWFSSVFFRGEKKIIAKSLFPRSDFAPLSSIALLFSGFHVSSISSSMDVVVALLNALPATACRLAETAWTRLHVKAGDLLLGYIGDSSNQVYLEVVQASTRPSQGLFAVVNVKISGGGWTLGGRIRYEIGFTSEKDVVISFSESEFFVNEKNDIAVTALPHILVGAGSENRVFPSGVLRVTDSEKVRYILHFKNCGSISGSVIDPFGQEKSAIDGHWLENVSLDSDLWWTFLSSKSTRAITLRRSDSSSSSSVVPAAGNEKRLLRMSSADEEASYFIQSLRNKLHAELEKFPNRFSDQYLFRFSKARNFDLVQTSAMLKQHIAWVEQHQIQHSLSFVYPELSLVQQAFPHGYHGIDKWGRPVYISRLAKTNQEALFLATNWERFTKYWIQSYEGLILKKIPECEKLGFKNPHVPGLPPPSSLAPLQTLTILDIKGIGLSQLNSRVREFISVTSKIASENYPEILGAMYIVNSPTVFPMIWNAIKGMIDPGTRAKTHVINAKHTKEKLLEVISPDQLPFFLGGACKCLPNDPSHDREDSDFGCLSSNRGPWNDNNQPSPPHLV